MARFDEIVISEIQFITENGQMAANADVLFRNGDATGPELVVKLSVDVAQTDTVEVLQANLAMEATRLLREVAGLPDETVSERVRLGFRSYADHDPSEG